MGRVAVAAAVVACSSLLKRASLVFLGGIYGALIVADGISSPLGTCQSAHSKLPMQETRTLSALVCGGKPLGVFTVSLERLTPLLQNLMLAIL